MKLISNLDLNSLRSGVCIFMAWWKLDINHHIYSNKFKKIMSSRYSFLNRSERE